MKKAKTIGFYMKTEKGNIAHVRGSDKMSKETIKAIEKMIDLVIENKDI